MKIKMLKNEKGSQCGKITEEFEKGKVYDVTERLAKVFVDNKFAVNAEDKKAMAKAKKAEEKEAAAKVEADAKAEEEAELAKLQAEEDAAKEAEKETKVVDGNETEKKDK